MGHSYLIKAWRGLKFELYYERVQVFGGRSPRRHGIVQCDAHSLHIVSQGNASLILEFRAWQLPPPAPSLPPQILHPLQTPTATLRTSTKEVRFIIWSACKGQAIMGTLIHKLSMAEIHPTWDEKTSNSRVSSNFELRSSTGLELKFLEYCGRPWAATLLSKTAPYFLLMHLRVYKLLLCKDKQQVYKEEIERNLTTS